MNPEFGYSPEDQKRAEESLEEFREEKRQNILNQKRVDHDPSIHRDQGEQVDHNSKKKILKAKLGKIKDRFNKPALKLKLSKEWDPEEDKDS